MTFVETEETFGDGVVLSADLGGDGAGASFLFAVLATVFDFCSRLCLQVHDISFRSATMRAIGMPARMLEIAINALPHLVFLQLFSSGLLLLGFRSHSVSCRLREGNGAI